jgi:carboxyl-terminal processing protease
MQPRPTNSLGALKYTIRKFYRVSGSSTQLRGVIPDVILPAINNHAEIGEAAMPNALPWDTIQKADFEPANLVAPVLADLRRRSETRVEQDKDFKTIREDIERYKKIKEDKTVSMNEQERFREKKENEDRAEARKKELRSRPEPAYKTYDITLKIVDEPGLPAPTVATNKLADHTAAAWRTELDEAEAAELEDKNDSMPAFDPIMDEGKRVLTDLIDLMAKTKGLAGPAR